MTALKALQRPALMALMALMALKPLRWPLRRLRQGSLKHYNYGTKYNFNSNCDSGALGGVQSAVYQQQPTDI